MTNETIAKYKEETVSQSLTDYHETEKRLIHDLCEAENKAWDSLARYKFQMFGYWAAIWVHLNRVGGFKLPNPFSELVSAARIHQETKRGRRP